MKRKATYMEQATHNYEHAQIPDTHTHTHTRQAYTLVVRMVPYVHRSATISFVPSSRGDPAQPSPLSWFRVTAARESGINEAQSQ
mmetsp:Transcript_61830/g.110109  ORF Transcript_61830/g.110109 Transcript_61830/m.110109 type:complete len:85 (-) Transcript_61830:71-325(-)